MGLSAELRQEILELEKNKPDMTYDDGGVEDKSVMLFLGGTGFGKSHLIRKMQALRPFPRLIREIGTETTRERKRGEDGDPVYYRTADEGVTHESFVNDIRAGKMINWSFIPRTDHLYGSSKKSFFAETTLAPMLPSSVGQIVKAGFMAVHIVYVLPDAADWHVRFDKQIEDRDPAFFSRLDEARESIEFVMNPPEGIDIIRVVNHHDEESLRKLAQGLLKICERPKDRAQRITLEDQFDREFNGQASTLHSSIIELLREDGR